MSGNAALKLSKITTYHIYVHSDATVCIDTTSFDLLPESKEIQ